MILPLMHFIRRSHCRPHASCHPGGAEQGADMCDHLRSSRPADQVRALAVSEKDAMLAQKLGQLQPFIDVSPQECVGRHISFGPTEQLSRYLSPRGLAPRATPCVRESKRVLTLFHRPAGRLTMCLAASRNGALAGSADPNMGASSCAGGPLSKPARGV